MFARLTIALFVLLSILLGLNAGDFTPEDAPQSFAVYESLGATIDVYRYFSIVEFQGDYQLRIDPKRYPLIFCDGFLADENGHNCVLAGNNEMTQVWPILLADNGNFSK